MRVLHRKIKNKKERWGYCIKRSKIKNQRWGYYTNRWKIKNTRSWRGIAQRSKNLDTIWRYYKNSVFKIAQNEVNLKKNNTTYEALKYCVKTLNKKNSPPPYHMEKDGGAKV